MLSPCSYPPRSVHSHHLTPSPHPEPPFTTRQHTSHHTSDKAPNQSCLLQYSAQNQYNHSPHAQLTPPPCHTLYALDLHGHPPSQLWPKKTSFTSLLLSSKNMIYSIPSWYITLLPSSHHSWQNTSATPSLLICPLTLVFPSLPSLSTFLNHAVNLITFPCLAFTAIGPSLPTMIKSFNDTDLMPQCTCSF